jgi:uracil-DNA glycosylase family 4
MADSLKKIRNPHCTLCKLHKDAEFVCLIGQGPTPCEIMVVGEAPGKREDDSGRAFVGKSGKLLEDHLERIGLSRDDVFISNAVHCRPLNNKTPSKSEIKTCHKYLADEIRVVKPKFILTLGNVPLMSLTGSGGIRKRRGKAFEWNGIIVLPTIHPASLLYDPENAYYFERDLARFREIVEFGGIPYERNIDYKIVDSWARVDEMIDDLYGTVSSDCETTTLYQWAPDAKIVSIGFGTARKQWIIPVHAEAWKVPWMHKDVVEILERVDDALEDCILVGHNWKFDRVWLRVHFGVDWSAQFDTMLAHYAINENARHGLDEISKFYFGAPDWDVDLKLKQGKAGKFEDHALYLAQDLYYTRKLRYRLQKELDKDWEIDRVFRRIIMPCADLFSEVEWRGCYVDKTKFRDAERYLRDELANAEKELKKFGDINWGSPKQVANLLYNKLRIKCPEKTKKGAPSTSESALNQIDHPCVASLFKYRGAKQQLSFFIEGWEPYLVEDRLHPSFKLHGTVTGRLSCEHPNFQQIPRDPRIRSLITAPAGWSLIEADLSQIELRIAAELSGDRKMTEAFNTGVDVHWLTALREIARGGGKEKEVIETAKTLTQRKDMKYAEAIDILLEAGPSACEEVLAEWKELRKKAKAINFGYLFGMWWKKFKKYARDNYGVEVSDEEAQESRKVFFDLYKDFVDWHKDQQKFAHRYGYIRSLSGRKRRLPDAMGYDDTPARAEAQRQAINSPVQSFANDLNLMAALQLRKEFPRSVLYIIATVHDAILIEVKNEWVPTVYKRLLQIMSHPDMMDEFGIKFTIPIEAEAKIGPWASGVKLEKWLANNKNLTFAADSPLAFQYRKKAA